VRGALALVRAQALTHASYRVNVLFSLAGMAATFIPVYFVAHALQPVAEASIRNEGEQYFGFLVVGLAVTYLLTFAMQALPNAISGGIGSGTLEALFATPTRLGELLAGMVGYEFLWTLFRATLLLVAMALVGAPVAWGSAPLALPILLLIVAAHLPVALVASALILVFRTSGPLIPGVLVASTLLGGVYYSTTVIPQVIQPLAALLPLTYGLRALRRALLAGEGPGVLLPDLAVLTAFAVVFLLLGGWCFLLALRHSRRTGSLAQY